MTPEPQSEEAVKQELKHIKEMADFREIYEKRITGLTRQLSERDKVVEKLVEASSAAWKFIESVNQYNYDGVTPNKVINDIESALQSAADLKRGRE